MMNTPKKNLGFAWLIRLAVMTVGGTLGMAQTPSAPPKTGISLLEAIQSTLANHPVLRSQQAQVDISRGLRMQASGVFDSVIGSGIGHTLTDSPLTNAQRQNLLASGVNSSTQTSNASNYTQEFDRLFRNGITVRPAFQLSRTTDNLFEQSGANGSNLSLLVTIPLLRGRGRSAVAAGEEAAKAEVEATVFDLNQLMSQLMLNTATSYWNLIAASKAEAIANEAEQRGKMYLDNVQAFITADHVAHNDLHEVTANLAQRAATRIAAEQQLIVARQQLALDMGYNADQMFSLPDPLDDFPDGENQQPPAHAVSDLQYYLDQALHNRADLWATLRRTAESRSLLAAAKNRLLPQIDLKLGSSYSGLAEGRRFGDFFSSAILGVPGPGATATINYTFPPNNQAARGSLLQVDAAARQAELQNRELTRQISAAVVVTVEGVRNTILRLNKTREAVESFQAALAGQREKYSAGLGSITDVLTLEDRLTTALTEQVRAQVAYAVAIVQFRFATGTLISADRRSQNVRAEIFSTLPFTSAPAHPRDVLP